MKNTCPTPNSPPSLQVSLQHNNLSEVVTKMTQTNFVTSSNCAATCHPTHKTKNLSIYITTTKRQVQFKTFEKMGDQALVVCSERNMGIGISVWSIESGEFLLHIPTCAAPPHGLVCIRDQFVVASQVSKHGSVGGGSIFVWSLNKPHAPQRNYTMESIWPICSTKDGVYIAGGAPSGNIYLWEVVNGRLLKTWRAHHKSLKCLTFSVDGSLLISASEDGLICVWSLISLLDMDDFVSLPSMLHCLLGHKSSITGLSTLASSVLISSSLDGTCKAWDLISGRLVSTQSYPSAITAITIDPIEQLACCGCIDGSILVNPLTIIELLDDHHSVANHHGVSLTGHNGSITALVFCNLGLISASDDRTVCIWDIAKRLVIRRFNHHKGPVSNVAVVPKSSLDHISNRRRISNQSFIISALEKYPKTKNVEKGVISVLPASCNINKQGDSFDLHVQDLLDLFKFDAEQPFGTLEMKVETYKDNRVWATNMAKHVMDINQHLQGCLLNMMRYRLLLPSTKTGSAISKKKKLKMEDCSSKISKFST